MIQDVIFRKHLIIFLWSFLLLVIISTQLSYTIFAGLDTPNK